MFYGEKMWITTDNLNKKSLSIGMDCRSAGNSRRKIRVMQTAVGIMEKNTRWYRHVR